MPMLANVGAMAITTLLFFFVARERWGWSALRAGAVAGVFLAIDLAFWGANLLKIPHGGWVPLVIGALNDGFRAGPQNTAGYAPGMWFYTTLAAVGLGFAWRLWRMDLRAAAA